MDARRRLETSSVHAVLDIIGDRWTLRILEALAAGPVRFEALLGDTGTPRSTLAARLRALATAEVIARTGAAYALTERGSELVEILALCRAWDGGDVVCGACERRTRAVMRCAHCGVDIRARDVTYADPPAPRPLPRRRKRRARIDHHAGDPRAADLLEDRWSATIIAAAFFGVRRFAELESALGIAPNILTARLRYLVEAGVLARRRYQQRPERFEYRLTARGRALYPTVVRLVAWGDRWLRSGAGQSLMFEHTPCHSRLDTRVVCRRCEAPLRAAKFHYKSD